MAFNNSISITGNLVADPELKFVGSGGTAVVEARIAQTTKGTRRDGTEFEETIFISCQTWRDFAENIAASVSKGDRVNVTGKLKQRSYENREGQKVTIFEIDIESFGPDLRFARCTVERNEFKGGGNRGSYGNRGGGNARRQESVPADEVDGNFGIDDDAPATDDAPLF